MVPNAAPHPIRVLMLLDQPLVARTIELTLNHGAFLTRQVTTLREATRVVAEWRPQLAVIDMDLGGDMLKHITRQGTGNASGIPVLALTRRGDLQTKLAAFDQGADDILTVPFSPEELLARALVITRRATGAVPLNPVLRIGDIEIDIVQRQVRAGTSEIHLSGLEQSLLYLLVANAGEVVSRDEILDALWGTDFVTDSNVVDRHVRSLRAKLQNDWRKPRFIATVPGKGYRFVPTFREDGVPVPS